MTSILNYKSPPFEESSKVLSSLGNPKISKLIMTKYEFDQIISIRTNQLSRGAIPFVKITEDIKRNMDLRKIALQELQNTKKPKDMLELQSLREFIVHGQSSDRPKERMLATVLKDRFDDYIVNAGPEAIISKTSEGVKTWQQARETFSKLRKSETFTNI